MLPMLGACPFPHISPTIRLPARLLCPSRFVPTAASLCAALSPAMLVRFSSCRRPALRLVQALDLFASLLSLLSPYPYGRWVAFLVIMEQVERLMQASPWASFR